ncbi:MAG: flippase-like domain-containing protein [Deltaproteobacteria bacterium]|nr:flippase-like domain-containing protein [Deltaproteobacteria bacterium]
MRLKVGFVLALTAGCLAWVLWGVNLGEAALEVAEAQIAWVVPAWALFFACHAVRTLRLRALIGEPLPFWPLFGINAIGFLAINVIPLRLGEFVRPTLLLGAARGAVWAVLGRDLCRAPHGRADAVHVVVVAGVFCGAAASGCARRRR